MRNICHSKLRSWHDVGVPGIASYWKTYMPESYQEAQREFVALVDPFVAHAQLPRCQDSEVTNMVFAEWLAYDFQTSSSLTPLELYVDILQKEGRYQISSDLAQIACSQFFSEFWICWQHPSEQLSLIEDAFTGRTYRLRDKQISEMANWLEGLVALRIACVGDEWFDVGIAPMHDNYPMHADYADNISKFIEDHPEGSISDASGRGISYAAFAHQLLGAHGGYLPSLKVHHYGGQHDRVALVD